MRHITVGDDASNLSLSRKFFVLGLPRSRTAWLARFLSYGEFHCGHEDLRHLRSLDDVRAWMSQPFVGSSETAAAPWWRLIARYAPHARIVVVRRAPADVVESLLRIPGLIFDRPHLEALVRRLDRKLDQIEGRMANVLSVSFDDLNNEETCARVFEHCLPYGHDSAHWARFAPLNIQADMRALMQYFAAFRLQLDKFASVAKHQALAEMAAREPVVPTGFTFQAETFDAWEQDGPALFEAHCALVGESPGEWKGKNLPLMRSIYDRGAMQIMTARSNGRMFGYLMTLLTPSLSSMEIQSAVHTTFFASPEFPGLGLKLQRAALASLKARGVEEVFMQAGLRGSGARVGAMYRRLGAEPDGQMFRLNLAEA